MRRLALAAPLIGMLAATGAFAADPPAADPALAQFRQAYTTGTGLSYVVIKDDKGERIYRYGEASRQAAQKDMRGFMLFTCNSPHVFVVDNPPDKAALLKARVVKADEPDFKDLDAGKKFEDIAKEKSTDPGSGANGGDLGYFGPGQMVPEFEKAAFALEPGSYTKEPVQSQFGWHVIKVEDKRAKQPPAFDEVKEQFRNVLIRERYFTLAKQLREAAKVDVVDAAPGAQQLLLETT